MNWKIAADTGGTFTDVMGIRKDGSIHRVKVLSSGVLLVKARLVKRCRVEVEVPSSLPDDFFSGYTFTPTHRGDLSYAVLESSGKELILDATWPEAQSTKSVFAAQLSAGEEAPVLGARLLTGTPLADPLPVQEFRLATTRGTNALLEEKGVPVVFFVTRGFADLLRIHNQKRPDLFALYPHREEPLHTGVVEVFERMDSNGKVHVSLDEKRVRQEARKWREEGYQSACVALLHSYRNPFHERKVAEILHQEGFTHITESAQLSARRKFLPRAETALVNAYLSPILQSYTHRVQEVCGKARLRVMDSAGELRMVEHYRAKDSLVSGPAAGVMGVAMVGKKTGEERLLSFDMGGTSTDVARVQTWPDRCSQVKVGRALVLGDSLRIETVAAGGGSICGYSTGKFFVGPDSAGADPGPACYGNGGPLTVTDANLLLGRIPDDGFSMPIFRERAEKSLCELEEKISNEGGKLPAKEELLTGFLSLANQRMADAIHGISVREGYSPESHALLAFGGAGGQHACAIADLLGMTKILSPADAGLLSAYGLQKASVGRTVEEEKVGLLVNQENHLGERFARLEEKAMAELREEGFSEQDCKVRSRDLFLRFVGQETSYPIPWERKPMATLFCEHYRKLFGYVPDREVELVRIRLIAHAELANEEEEMFPESEESAEPNRCVRVFLGELQSNGHIENKNGVSAVRGLPGWYEIPLFLRKDLPIGAELSGPSLVVDPYSCLFIECGWKGGVGTDHSIKLDRVHIPDLESNVQAEWIQRELFSHRLTHIATEMGEQLRRTALSTNIKERLDFSCAILDAQGKLITNAPHIPVHLGALGECVRSCVKELRPEEGDVVLTNHPAYGGSHLPDVTLISPVYLPGRGKLLGYVANRAHHAELGGIVPGSMPPLAQSLGEEGVVLPPMFLYRKGEPCHEQCLQWMKEARYPSRAPEENQADLDAQVAANRLGAASFQELCQQYGSEKSQVFLEEMYQRSHQFAEAFFQKYEGRKLETVEELDGGSKIAVRYDFRKDGLVIDFEGTSPVAVGNPNATPAIVRSAVIYVIRLLLSQEIPLNEGLLERVRIVLPEGSLLSPVFVEDPFACPPVVAGNVEISQRLVDTLLKPFGLVACSQGTMNNFLFGSREKGGYYETIAGGAGAGPNRQGASGIHTHMTNTAITDPEILEARYPVRLEEFSIRKNSGGRGAFCGGDGVIRNIRFLRDSTVSILSQHRKAGPYGIEGGVAGKPGRQYLQHLDGTLQELPHEVQQDVRSGESIIIETPGGGGFGC